MAKRKIIEYFPDGNEYEARRRSNKRDMPILAILPFDQIRIGRKWFPFRKGLLRGLKLFLLACLAIFAVSVLGDLIK